MTTKKAIEELAYDLVDPDPNQPRKIFNEQKLTDLANDIGVNGILQAIVVRPHPTKKGRYMIIFGERRFRAAGMVDLETVPCVVRTDVNDAQALEWQMAENGQRDDMHPLEEADGYRTMHERDGRDVEEIAELTAKSKAYVYAAMKLCELAAEPRKAFLAGKFDKSVALLVARLPASQQATATKAILTEGEWDDDGRQPMSFREAKNYIRDEYMLRLAQAPFKVDDATLVAKAGPCTTCPKRTGNQRELFADVVDDKSAGGGDVCTDSTCYKAKLDVHWGRLAAVAKEKGRAVLEGKAGDHAGSYGDKHVRLDDRCFEDPKDRTYRQLLGKHADDAVVAIARDEGGHIKELVDKAALPKLFKVAGVKVEKERNSGKSQGDYDREAKEQRQLETAVTQAARDAVLAKLADAGDVLLWRLLARLAVRVARNDAQRELVKLHELKTEGDGHYKGGFTGALLDYVEGLPVRAARDFAVEALLAEAGGWREPDGESDYTNEGMTPEELAEEKAERRSYMTGLEHAAEVFDLDLAAIAEKAQKDLAAARKAKAEKKSKKNGEAPAAEATS